jgi:hypothetical protein
MCAGLQAWIWQKAKKSMAETRFSEIIHETNGAEQYYQSMENLKLS